MTKDEAIEIRRIAKDLHELGVVAHARSLRELASSAPTSEAVAEKPQAIPDGVYWRTGNFYDAGTAKGMGERFYIQWANRRDEFPRSPAAPEGSASPVPLSTTMREWENMPWAKIDMEKK